MQTAHHDPATLPRLNNAAMVRFAVIFGAALLLAMAAPKVLFAATLSSFLGMAALALAGMALFAREPVWAPHLTRWDVAAGLHLLALFAGFFVDLTAVQEFLQAQAARPH